MVNHQHPITWIAAAILILILNVAVCREECIAHERDALLRFKSALKDPMGRLHSWNGSDCCSWMGLECSKSNGHVVKLDLHNPKAEEDYESWEAYELWALKGTINSALFSLRYLEYLDLSGNGFDGNLSQLGSLALLEHLDLSSNFEFGGIIPSELGNFSRLKHLDLSFCTLSGVIPSEVGSLTLLEHLDLSDNSELGGVIPSELGNFTRLKHLDLHYCNFSGVIPSEVGALFALEHLYLSSVSSYNDLQLVHSLAWLPNSVSSNNDLQLEVHSLANLTVLTHLSLDGVNMSVVDKDWDEPFHRNSRLQYLSMYNSPFPALSIPSSLLNLTHLDLSASEIEGVIPHSIGNLTKLTELRLYDNKPNGSIPPSLGRLFSLRYLDLSHNQLSGSIPPSLSNLSSLTYLWLLDNQLSGRIPPSLSNLSSLQYLDLSQNQLNDTLHASFRLPTTLQFLDFSSNNLTGHISFDLFQNLTALTQVDLSDNHFTVHTTFLSPPAFQLESLNLASCNIEREFSGSDIHSIQSRRSRPLKKPNRRKYSGVAAATSLAIS